METGDDYLPPDCIVTNRSPTSMNKHKLEQWAISSIRHTKKFRFLFRHIVLFLDGFGGYISYHALNLFKENKVVVDALPSHKCY